MVKQSAISNPQAIVDAYSDKVNGSTKKSSCISAIKRIIKINTTKQPFVEDPEPILTLAVGQKPIDRNGIVLSENKNETHYSLCH
jgi:hypothetical protein